MKVKDATQMWLLVWTKSGRPLMKNHYFPTKGKSICGRAEHPKNQPNAMFIQNEDCKACMKKAPVKPD
jgi:hypothetical protein